MKKLLSIFAAALFAMSMFAAETVTMQYSGATANMAGNGANNAELVGLNAELFTVLSVKGKASNEIGLNKDGTIRLYSEKESGDGNTLTVTCNDGAIISSIVLDIKQETDFVVKADGAEVAETDGKFVINAPSFSIQNVFKGDKNAQLQLNSIAMLFEEGGGEDPVADGFYLVANAFEWDLSAAARFDENLGTKGEYMVRIWLEEGFDYEMKVVKVEDGKEAQWYPGDGEPNMKPEERGDLTVYFRPEGNAAWEWNFIYLTPAPEHYYLVGDFTDWELDTDYEFQLNEGAGVEEWHLEMQLPTAEWLEKENSDIKVIGVIGDPTDKSNWIWFPGDGVANMTPENYGIVDIYFRPQGNPEWKNVFTYVAEHVVNYEYYLLSDKTDPAWERREEMKFKPIEGKEGMFELAAELVEGEHIKGLIVADGKEIATIPQIPGIDNYWTVDAEHAGDVVISLSLVEIPEWAEAFPAGDGLILIEVAPDYILPSKAKELALSGNTDAYKIQGYVSSIVEPWTKEYGNVSFWLADEIGGEELFQAFRISCAEEDVPGVNDYVWVTGSLKKYTKDGVSIAETDNKKDQAFGIIKKYEPAPELPANGFYLVGDRTEWQVIGDYPFTRNLGSDAEEYMLHSFIGPEESFQVVKVEDGKVTWYPGGEENNIKPGVEGDFMIYFRPEGNDSWLWKYVYITESPNHFYLVGDFTEWKLDEQYEFEINMEAEGEEWKLQLQLPDAESLGLDRSEIKVLGLIGDDPTVESNYVWYPSGDNMVPEIYGIVDVYFRPAGKADWKNVFAYVAEHKVVYEYYLLSDQSGWDVMAENKFQPNPENEGEFMLSLTLVEGEKLKGVVYTDGAKFITLPGEGEEDVWTIDAAHAGDVTIYLSPAPRADWAKNFPEGMGFIWIEVAPDYILPSEAKELALSGNTDAYKIQGYVASIAEAWTSEYGNVSFWLTDEIGGEELFEVFRISCAEEDVPGVNDYVWVTGSLKVYTKSGVSIAETDNKKDQAFGIIKKYEPEPEPLADGFYLKMIVEGEEIIDRDAKFYQNYACVETVEYMLRMFISPDADYQLSVVEIADGEVVNTYPGEEGAYMVPDKSGDLYMYFRPGGKSDWDLFYIYLDEAPEAYYLVGEFNDWKLLEEYQFSYNMEADAEEWVVRAEFSPGAFFKVVGLRGEEWIWYPDGENMISEIGGDVDVYFRPQGNPAWGQFYAYVAEHKEIDYLSCAEVVLLAESIAEPTASEKTTSNGDIVTVRGYVTFAYDPKDNAPVRKAQFQSVWLADEEGASAGVVQVFNAEITAQLQKGDFVEATGTLCKYWKGEGNVIIEIMDGTLEKIGGGGGEEIDIVCTDLDIDDSYYVDYGVVILTGTTAEFDVEAYLYPEDETALYGDYTSETAEVYLINPADEEDYILVTVSEAKFENTVDGDVFTATGLGDDDNLYTITMKLVIPDPIGTKEIEFKSLGEYQYYGESLDWYYYVEDEGDKAFTLDIVSENRAGEFVDEDVDFHYTALYVDGESTKIKFYTMKATITENEAGEGLVVAEGLGNDAYIYKITFKYQVVKPTETVEISDEDAQFFDYIESDGIFGILGTDAEAGVTMQLYVISEQVVGAYTFKDLYTGYSGVMVGEETFGIVDGTFDVSIEDEYWVVIQGEVLASNGVSYKFVFKSNQEPMAVDNVNGENTVVKTLRDGQLVIIKNGVEYNVIGARVK